jgi:hypothetical protein
MKRMVGKEQLEVRVSFIMHTQQLSLPQWCEMASGPPIWQLVMLSHSVGPIFIFLIFRHMEPASPKVKMSGAERILVNLWVRIVYAHLMHRSSPDVYFSLQYKRVRAVCYILQSLKVMWLSLVLFLAVTISEDSLFHGFDLCNRAEEKELAQSRKYHLRSATCLEKKRTRPMCPLQVVNTSNRVNKGHSLPDIHQRLSKPVCLYTPFISPSSSKPQRSVNCDPSSSPIMRPTNTLGFSDLL